MNYVDPWGEQGWEADFNITGREYNKEHPQVQRPLKVAEVLKVAFGMRLKYDPVLLYGEATQNLDWEGASEKFFGNLPWAKLKQNLTARAQNIFYPKWQRNIAAVGAAGVDVFTPPAWGMAQSVINPIFDASYWAEKAAASNNWWDVAWHADRALGYYSFSLFNAALAGQVAHMPFESLPKAGVVTEAKIEPLGTDTSAELNRQPVSPPASKPATSPPNSATPLTDTGTPYNHGPFTVGQDSPASTGQGIASSLESFSAEIQDSSTSLNYIDDAFADMAKFREELGGIPAKSGRLANGGTLARLDIADETIYGMSGHGQPVTVNASNFQFGHAETDALQQAFNKGIVADEATMFVDRALCRYCQRIDGLRSIMKDLGLKQLVVHDPESTWLITPDAITPTRR